jgi:hypothetical protein
MVGQERLARPDLAHLSLDGSLPNFSWGYC